METMTPEVVEETAREGSTALAHAEALEIVDDSGCEIANQMLLGAASYDKRVVDTFAPMKGKAYDAHQEICKTENQLRAPAKQTKTILKKKIGDYLDKQERLAQIEADKERKALEAQALKDAEAQRERDAEAAAEADDEEAFEEITEAPIEVAPAAPPPPRAMPSTAGVTHSKVWKFEVVAPLKIPRKYLMVDKVKIGRVVTAMKGDTKIAGVRAYPERQIGARG